MNDHSDTSARVLYIFMCICESHEERTHKVAQNSTLFTVCYDKLSKCEQQQNTIKITTMRDE